MVHISRFSLDDILEEMKSTLGWLNLNLCLTFYVRRYVKPCCILNYRLVLGPKIWPTWAKKAKPKCTVKVEIRC